MAGVLRNSAIHAKLDTKSRTCDRCKNVVKKHSEIDVWIVPSGHTGKHDSRLLCTKCSEYILSLIDNGEA